MQSLFRSGRSLKRAGTLLFILGAALTVGPWAYSRASSFASSTWKRTKPQAGAWISNAVTSFKKSTQPTPTAPAPPPPPPVTLDDAKKAIPGVLKNIYAALNEGNPQAVAQHLHKDILNNPKGLDYICQPFNYRAHYIESLVERPNQWFLVRVRTLFKPLNERSYLMTFGIWNGKFYLHYGEDDSFPLEKQVGAALSRKFVFAARSGEWEIVRGLASQQFDVDRLKEGEWPSIWASVKEGIVEDGAISLISHHGLKLNVPVRVESGWLANRIHLQFEMTDNQMKVVRVVYDTPGQDRQITASDLEMSTLSRFGLSQNRTHPALSSDTPSLEARQ